MDLLAAIEFTLAAWTAEVVGAFERLGLEVTETRVNKVKNYRPKVKHYVLDIYAKMRI